MAESEINKIGEVLNIDELESNLIDNVTLKPNEFGESCRRNTHFMRPKYIAAGRTINFYVGFILKRTTFVKEIILHQLVKQAIF